MRWVRAHLQAALRLALFALVLQNALAFGHVHLDGANLALRHATTVQSPGQPGDAAPVTPASDRDDLCPICLLIHLAGTSLQSTPPALPLPETATWSPPQTALHVAAASYHSSFNARAPPAV